MAHILARGMFRIPQPHTECSLRMCLLAVPYARVCNVRFCWTLSPCLMGWLSARPAHCFHDIAMCSQLSISIIPSGCAKPQEASSATLSSSVLISVPMQDMEGLSKSLADILRCQNGAGGQHSCCGLGSTSVCLCHSPGRRSVRAHRLRLHTRCGLPQNNQRVR